MAYGDQLNRSNLTTTFDTSPLWNAGNLSVDAGNTHPAGSTNLFVAAQPQYGDAAFNISALSLQPIWAGTNQLVITASKNPTTGAWTSGQVSTVDTNNVGWKQSGGIFECLVSLPQGGKCAFPAFWLGGGFGDVTSMVNPELDIFEKQASDNYFSSGYIEHPAKGTTLSNPYLTGISFTETSPVFLPGSVCKFTCEIVTDKAAAIVGAPAGTIIIYFNETERVRYAPDKMHTSSWGPSSLIPMGMLCTFAVSKSFGSAGAPGGGANIDTLPPWVGTINDLTNPSTMAVRWLKAWLR
jgi:hypothetical protein